MKIYIHFSEDMVQTALCDTEGNLLELLTDKKGDESIVGHIYAGTVQNILPNQFAFLDIGAEKNAFLHLSDPKEARLYKNGKLTIKPGKSLLIQVTKDAVGDKGPAVTTQLSMSGRHAVVFLSGAPESGVSKKIEDVKERRRLKKMAGKLLAGRQMGLILRTESAGIKAEELEAEVTGLAEHLERVIKRARYVKPPKALYTLGGQLQQAIGQLLTGAVTDIVVDHQKHLKQVREAAKALAFTGDVSLYPKDRDMFNDAGIKKQLEQALDKKVWLPSGGFIVIEQTEACVVIDVNTGKFIGTKSQQKTVIKTNKEAALEIAKQLRLRNLSGMIIIDFIDLRSEAEKQRLVDTLATAVKKDRLPVNVIGMTQLGVVMLTRKKEREPTIRFLRKPCPTCGGTGFIHI